MGKDAQLIPAGLKLMLGTPEKPRCRFALIEAANSDPERRHPLDNTRGHGGCLEMTRPGSVQEL